jgi:hypothetical protein
MIEMRPLEGIVVTRAVARHARPPVALIVSARGASSIAGAFERLLRAATRRVSVLVAATSPRRIVRQGLQLDRCSVAAISDTAPPADSEEFRRGIEVVLKATSGFVVIDAANAAAVAATRGVDRARVVLCAPRENEAVRLHAAAGGPVVTRRSRCGHAVIELRSAGIVLASAAVPSVGVTGDTGRRRRLRALMFAVALAFGLGLSPQEIAAAAENRGAGILGVWARQSTAGRRERACSGVT